MPLLELIDVGVDHGGGTSGSQLGPLKLALDAGDVLTLKGRSGSGKTTLLRCIAMLEAQAYGIVKHRGQPVADAAVPAYRADIVLVAQNPARFDTDVAQSLRLAFEYKAVEATYDAKRAQSLCEQLLLPPDILSRDLGSVSGGEAQRIALIRALLIEPSVLLLDEPTSALDADARSAVHALLREWLGAGERAIVCVTHDDAALAALATRASSIVDGQLRAESQP